MSKSKAGPVKTALPSKIMRENEKAGKKTNYVCNDNNMFGPDILFIPDAENRGKRLGRRLPIWRT